MHIISKYLNIYIYMYYVGDGHVVPSRNGGVMHEVPKLVDQMLSK